MVAAAYLINGYRHFFMSGSAIKDKTSFLGYASIMTIIINLLLNNWLIGSFGIWGAVFTTLLSYIILSVTILMASQTIIKVNWGWPKISGVMLCMVIFILIHEYIISSNFLPNWTLKSIIFIGYILTLRLTGLISQKEIKGLLELMDKIMSRLAIKNSN
jgi:O-antigen/teichoic acid export membrane protein